MSDAGVVLVIRRSDGFDLTARDHARVRDSVEWLRREHAGLVGELDNHAVWKDGALGQVQNVMIFEHWGADLDLNVLNADGSISPPKYEMRVIEGEEVEVPLVPPEGNPNADEMLALLLARDAAIAERALLGSALSERLGPELKAAVVAEYW